MKAILISIKPKYVAKILNGEKTIEIRKTAPKEWKRFWNDKRIVIMPEPIDVYIYCTKGKYSELCYFDDCGYQQTMVNHIHNLSTCNGKVVAKFTLNKVEEIIEDKTIGVPYFNTQSLLARYLCKNSCLTPYDFNDYFKGKKGYAWHIDNLEIFDRPKELSEFYKGFRNKYYKNHFAQDIHKEKNALVQPIKCGYEYTYPLTKAPQNYCYIESEELL